VIHAAQLARDVRRIVVADRSSMQCELLAKALKVESDFDIVGTASTSTEALFLLQRFEPSVAIVSADLRDGPRAGLEVIAKVQAQNWRTQSIVLLDRSDRQLVVDAFRNGARGVFSREQPFEIFPKCIRAILQGQVWVNTAEMNYILGALTSPQSLHLMDGHGKSVLTHRESEVTYLVTEGLSNREIALKLDLSEHTVKNYLFRIFDKTGVSSRVGLVLYAMSRLLILCSLIQDLAAVLLSQIFPIQVLG
jgi:two-component system nitrate/nitrite response regulator NarL